LFNRGSGGNPCAAIDIGEVVACDTPLSAGNRALTLAYLKTKWGTP